MGVGQLSESDAVDALRLPFYSSSHPTGSHGWRNQFDLGNPDLIVFALTSELVGSYPLAMGLLFLMGIFTSTYMISIQSSLQMMVPDAMRGRVMGFYGMTWSIMPLGGLQAGALAEFTSAPFALVAGGIAVATFALGPALINGRIRNMGQNLSLTEAAALSTDESPATSPTPGNS